MLEWILDNIQWIFSGIGVFVLSSILYGKYNKKENNSSIHSESSVENSNNCNNGTTINASGNSRVILESIPEKNEAIVEENNNKDKHSITIEGQKAQTIILFIDNEDFQIVNIIKKSGWKNCSLIKKVLDLNIDKIKKAHIIFVDIKGVGEELFGKDAGLGVAKALKEKYSEKTIVLYSAESNWNIFHEAINMVDERIEKNAKPIEFVSLIEMYADKIWKKRL